MKSDQSSFLLEKLGGGVALLKWCAIGKLAKPDISSFSPLPIPTGQICTSRTICGVSKVSKNLKGFDEPQMVLEDPPLLGFTVFKGNQEVTRGGACATLGPCGDRPASPLPRESDTGVTQGGLTGGGAEATPPCFSKFSTLALSSPSRRACSIDAACTCAKFVRTSAKSWELSFYATFWSNKRKACRHFST